MLKTPPRLFRRISLALAVGSLLISAAAVAVTQEALKESDEPMDVPARTYTQIKKLPNAVTLATLSNGLTVIVQENHVAPVATVRCYVRNTGSAFESEYLGAGLSHVLEHVVAGGTTTRRGEKEIEAIIDEFGGATNAYTSKDITAYYIDCPARDVPMAVELIADSMQHIVFEPSEFERELKVVQQELRDGEANRQRVLWNLLSRTVYTRHPARHPVIGYLEVLQGMRNEEIQDFYRRRYTPNNQVFVVVGSVQTDEILALVARQFDGTPRAAETTVAMPEEPLQLTPRTTIREMDGGTYDIVLAWPTIRLSDPDLYAMDLAAYILSEGDSSRLARKLKFEQQVVLNVASSSYTPAYVQGYFGVFATATPENWERARGQILREVYRLREELVDAQTLAKAKKQKATELIFGQQTVQEAAEGLARSFISTGDPLFDEAYVEGIQQVTAEQIRDVARKYFVPSRLNTVVIAPPGGAPRDEGRAADADQGEILSCSLPNGARVLLKRHAHLPMVNVQAFTLGSCLVDSPETAGRAALTAMMLDKGTPNYSAHQIAEYFDSIGGGLSISAGRNTLIGSVSVLKEDFAAATAVLAECLHSPTFPEDEFEKMKTLALGQIARRADNPQQEIFEFFYQNLPESSPYHVIQGGTRASVERLTVADIRDYHARYVVPENLLVTVFGDIDPAGALAVVERAFGRMPKSAGWTPVAFDRANTMSESKELHKKTGKEAGMVVIGYPAVGVFQHEDYAALTVLDAIMSGHKYPGGWLHNELRGQGLVYGVHATLLSGPAPGYFIIMAQTAPANVGEVVSRIRVNVEKAKAGHITEEEFSRAKRMIIALHAQENTTVAQQAQQAGLDALYGLGHDDDAKFDARIEAVTLDDVIRVANQYLTTNLTVTSSSADQP